MPFQFNAVVKAMKESNYKRISQVNTNEWSILEDYMVVLQPIANALDKMQREKDGCAGHIMPTLFYLDYQFKRIIPETNVGIALKNAVIEAFHTRFHKLMAIETENIDLIVASVSHPKYKLNWINNHEDKKTAEEMFIRECRKIAQDIGRLENAASTTEYTFYDRFLENDFPQERNRHFMDEISRFLSISSLEVLVLHDYPVIRKVFRKFNSTISSSAPIERLFSQGPLIFTARRNRLSATNFEKALLLNKNSSCSI